MPAPATLIEDCERIARSLLDVADAGVPGKVNRELVSALAGHGLFDRLFSSDQVTATELCAIRQGLARVSTHAETAFAVQGLGAIPIHLPAMRSPGSDGSLRSVPARRWPHSPSPSRVLVPTPPPW